jgi:hypothetical protein
MLDRYRQSYSDWCVSFRLSCKVRKRANRTIGAARNGANLILHHLGESTQLDIEEVEKACKDQGAKTVIVAGDIANQETAVAVSPLVWLSLMYRSSKLGYQPFPV